MGELIIFKVEIGHYSKNTVRVFSLCQPRRIAGWFCLAGTLPHKVGPAQEPCREKLSQPVYSEKPFRVSGGLCSYVQWGLRDCPLEHADLKNSNVRWHHATALGCPAKLALTNTNKFGFESGTASPGPSEHGLPALPIAASESRGATGRG